jgi:hypothetical protein
LAGFICGEVEFRDDSSLLFFRELIDLFPPLQKVMYAYRYQKADGELNFSLRQYCPSQINFHISNSQTLSGREYNLFRSSFVGTSITRD